MFKYFKFDKVYKQALCKDIRIYEGFCFLQLFSTERNYFVLCLCFDARVVQTFLRKNSKPGKTIWWRSPLD